MYRILIAVFLPSPPPPRPPPARDTVCAVRFCFRSIIGGSMASRSVTATLRLLCADKLRETRLRRARRSVRDEGEKSRIRISVCLFRGSVKKRGVTRTSAVGCRVVKPELYQQCIFLLPFAKRAVPGRGGTSARPAINDLSRSRSRARTNFISR